jgi:hypothetical protein
MSPQQTADVIQEALEVVERGLSVQERVLLSEQSGGRRMKKAFRSPVEIGLNKLEWVVAP